MADEIIIVNNTVEEITIEEFAGTPTGTIITSTHGMDRGDQHTIKDIVGLKDKLHDIEKLHPVRSNLGGHADYYQWGEEATEDNPLGPGYFVRLDDDGMIHKCTNETTVLRPADLSLNTDENGKVVIYALAGNITNPDTNKCYVVGAEVPYDIYAYDGINLVQKSAYSYDGEKVIKTCHTTDVLGVTVDSAGFVGNDANIEGTYTSIKAKDASQYALVATTGVVDVLCDHSVLVGDYVFPTVGGCAAKSTGTYGYLVTALVQKGVIVQTVNKEEMLYARVVLSQSMVNAKKVSDNVDYLLAETKRIGENVVKAVSDAQTALNEVRDVDNGLSDRVNNFESSMNAMGEQLYTNTVAVGNANSKAAEAERIANQAKTYVDEVVATTGGDAASALADASYAKAEVEKLSQSMTPITNYTNEQGEVVGAYGIVNKQDELGGVVADIQTWREDDVNGYAATVKRVSATETSISDLTQFESDMTETMAQIKQKSDEQGASITALTSKIDKYSVGEYSQAYGLTQAQAADILEAGKIVFIPTNFVSSDASFTERYNPIVLDGWSVTDKNPKYIYEVGGNYYYHNGTSWVSDTISNMQLAGYCVTNFVEGYSYEWNGLKWVPAASINVFFTDDAPATMSTPNPLYWVVGSGHCISKTATEWGTLTTKDPKKEYYITDTKKYYYYDGTAWIEATEPQYKIGGLYLAVYNSTSQTWEWKECALGSSNSMSRVSAIVEQTQNSWQTSISNVKGDMAALSAKVDENGSNVAMVASVVKEVDGVNLDFADNTEKTPYTSKDDIVSTDKTKYFVVGTKTPYDIYYYDGTTYVQKINWSYDGQRVLQPNTASIVTSANEDTSGIKLSADHITFEGTTYKVDAKYIDFTGEEYTINANRINFDGNATFSGYAKTENVIVDQRVEYAHSKQHDAFVAVDGDKGQWSTTYDPNCATGTYLWRKTTMIKGNNKEVSHQECISGIDGKSYTMVGNASSVMPYNTSLYMVYYNDQIVSTASIGDAYLYDDGCLYVCSSVLNDGVDLFTKIEGFQGPAGASLEIIYRGFDAVPESAPDTPVGTSPANWSVTVPAKNVVYMSQKLSNVATWSTPVRITGEKGEQGADGTTIEFIYCLTAKNEEPEIGATTATGASITGEKDEEIPDGWNDQPQLMSETSPYQWMSQRIRKSGMSDWGDFSTPVIWSKWGEKGNDGDGIEFWYCLSDTKRDDLSVTATYGNPLPDPWKPNPLSTSAQNPYQYVVQVKSSDGANANYTASLWSIYDGMLVLFVAGKTLPTIPSKSTYVEGSGYKAYSSPVLYWQENVPTSLSTGDVIWMTSKTVLGPTWSNPTRISAVDGAPGKPITNMMTYYLVTTTDEKPTVGTDSWKTSIEGWGSKDASGEIYQYLWVRELLIYEDKSEAWTDPRLDASMTTIGNWCAENDKTLINGGNIATGTIKADQIDANAITADKIDANAITSNKIAAKAITADHINVGDLSALKATIGGWSISDTAISKKFTDESGDYYTQLKGDSVDDVVIGVKRILRCDYTAEVSITDNLSAVKIDIVSKNDNMPNLITDEHFVVFVVVDGYDKNYEIIVEAGKNSAVLDNIGIIRSATFFGGKTIEDFSQTATNYPFSVTSTGSLHAEDADITGTINAAGGGNIAGFNIVAETGFFNRELLGYTNNEFPSISEETPSGVYGCTKTASKTISIIKDIVVVNEKDVGSEYVTIKTISDESTRPQGWSRIIYYKAKYDGSTLTLTTDVTYSWDSTPPVMIEAPSLVCIIQYMKYTDQKLVSSLSSHDFKLSNTVINDDGDVVTALEFYDEDNISTTQLDSNAIISPKIRSTGDIIFDNNISGKNGVIDTISTNKLTNSETSIELDWKGLSSGADDIEIVAEVAKSNNGLVVRTSRPLESRRDFRVCYYKPFNGQRYITTITIGAGESYGANTNTGKVNTCFFEGSTSTMTFYQKPIETADIGITGSLIPTKDAKVEDGYFLGSSDNYWAGLYANTIYATNEINTSDRNLKTNIVPLDDKYSDLFDKLEPVSFKFISDKDGKTHTGLIAQDLMQAAKDVGFTAQDLAAYSEWGNGDGGTTCGIAYTELIALNIHEIQKLKARITEQDKKIASLEAKLNKLIGAE